MSSVQNVLVHVVPQSTIRDLEVHSSPFPNYRSFLPEIQTFLVSISMNNAMQRNKPRSFSHGWFHGLSWQAVPEWEEGLPELVIRPRPFEGGGRTGTDRSEIGQCGTVLGVFFGTRASSCQTNFLTLLISVSIQKFARSKVCVDLFVCFLVGWFFGWLVGWFVVWKEKSQTVAFFSLIYLFPPPPPPPLPPRPHF